MKRILTAMTAVALLTTSTGAALAQPDRHDGPPPAAGHHWRKGDRIDHDSWGRAAPVDYRAHHLRRPPRGYEWRDVDGNYVLAAVATGLIASAIAHH